MRFNEPASRMNSILNCLENDVMHFFRLNRYHILKSRDTSSLLRNFRSLSLERCVQKIAFCLSSSSCPTGFYRGEVRSLVRVALLHITSSLTLFLPCCLVNTRFISIIQNQLRMSIAPLISIMLLILVEPLFCTLACQVDL